jgi:curli biogenesis system outer membrane secretion channel CsgG
MRLFFAAITSAILWFASFGVAPAAGPTVAVLNFDTSGLTSNWWGSFQPGVAISDLVTDQLVNAGTFNVVDRAHITQTMQEHQLSTSGEVSPATAVQSGQLLGARYLIVGNVLQFDKTGQSGGTGGVVNLPFGIGGHVSNERVTLQVAVHVIDATTGQILQSFKDEQSKSSTSWGAGGLGGLTGGIVGGSYSNTQFTSSTMGQLINTVAADIAAKLDPAKFAAAPTGPALSGKIIAVSGHSYILNIGSGQGVAVGTYFDVFRVKQIKDPDSGRMLTSRLPLGKIQITSVDVQTSVGTALPGAGGLNTSAVGATVQTSP